MPFVTSQSTLSEKRSKKKKERIDFLISGEFLVSAANDKLDI